jgi:hypothetical protein
VSKELHSSSSSSSSPGSGVTGVLGDTGGGTGALLCLSRFLEAGWLPAGGGKGDCLIPGEVGAGGSEGWLTPEDGVTGRGGVPGDGVGVGAVGLGLAVAGGGGVGNAGRFLG